MTKLSEKALQNKKIDKITGLTKKETIEKIISETELTEKDIMASVKDKKQELKGLISDEGALFIVAKEFGVELPKKRKNLSDDLGIKNPNIKKIIDAKTTPSMFDDTETIEPQKQPETIKKEQEPSKYPLEPIIINKKALTLTEAKEKILEDIELYNFTLQNIVNEKDFVRIGGNKHLCKSGVRKIQLALNISTEIISNEVWKEKDQWVAKYIVKAMAPSGRFATSVGVCEQFEKGRTRTRHETEATAQTRGSSRAILDLVGFGAVSAAEIDDSKDRDVKAGPSMF